MVLILTLPGPDVVVSSGALSMLLGDKECTVRASLCATTATILTLRRTKWLLQVNNVE